MSRNYLVVPRISFELLRLRMEGPEEELNDYIQCNKCKEEFEYIIEEKIIQKQEIKTTYIIEEIKQLYVVCPYCKREIYLWRSNTKISELHREKIERMVEFIKEKYKKNNKVADSIITLWRCMYFEMIGEYRKLNGKVGSIR